MTAGPKCERRAAARSDRLEGWCILIVEDEAVIGMELQSVFEEAGAEVVGPAHTLAEALKHARHAVLSAAVLDLRLGVDPVTSVALLLAERAIPFIIYSGQPADDPVCLSCPPAPILSKPATGNELVTAVAKLLQR